MAEALAVVKVGKREWLFAKLTPWVRIQNILGVSSAFTEPARNPSKTKITTLRGCFPAGSACPERKARSTGHNASANANQTSLLFIPRPFPHQREKRCVKYMLPIPLAPYEADTFCLRVALSTSGRCCATRIRLEPE